MSEAAVPPPAPPKKSKAWRRWAIELGVVAAVFLGVTFWRERNLLPSDGAAIAPPFSLRALDGTEVRLEDLAGKTVLLHFWATWCGVCRAELPMLRALYRGLAKDEAMLTIVVSDDPDEVRDFVRERELPYPVLLADGNVVAAYGVNAFPTNYVVDASGRIAGRAVGLTTRLGVWARMSCAGR